MSEQTSFEALRARKRADHLIDLRDEIASALTHGLGADAALAGGAVLITLAAIYGDGWQLGASIVFGVTLLLLYTASTLYHAMQHPVAKGWLKVFDHCAIYLLIAGTYTPFTPIGLRGPWGWGLFTAIYTAMGWLVIVAVKPLLNAVDPQTLCWMLAGGLFYTLGTFFYHRESIRYSHAIWHLFVLGGSVCHFVAVTQQILMPRLAS